MIIKNNSDENQSTHLTFIIIIFFLIVLLLINFSTREMFLSLKEGFASDNGLNVRHDTVTNSVGDIVKNKDDSLTYNSISGAFSRISDIVFGTGKPEAQLTNSLIMKETIPEIIPETISMIKEEIPEYNPKPKIEQEIVLPENIKPSLAALNAVSTEGLAGTGRILDIKNLNDIDNLMIGGEFKLRVNLPMMPPYIKGLEFDVKKGKDPNYFYLCVEKLIPNCSLSSPTDQCFNVFVDDKSKCNIKALTNYTSNNSYRLVLVSAQYVFAPDSILGKNSDFTLIKFDGKLYLKNIQTGYMPNLYMNDKTYGIYGDINNDKQSNVGAVFDNIYNRQCVFDAKKDRFNPEPAKSAVKDKTLRLEKPGCDYNPDKTIYLMTSNNIGESTPVRITINADNSISIKLLRYNSYGNATDIYQLSACEFNIKTFYGIQQVNTPQPIGPINVNVACYEKESESKNRLNFTVELNKFPSDFMKKNSIFSLN